MKEEYIYFIVFNDGSIQLYLMPMNKKDFQKGARCYRVSESFTVEELRVFVYTDRGYSNDPKIKQIW